MPGDTAIQDAAVRKATGRGWKQWFALLDHANATAMDHAAIARWLNEELEIPGWWAQMVTVQYERERGLRQVNQKADGFAVNVSRTVRAPVARVFQAFTHPADVSQWFAPRHVADVRPGGTYRNAEGDRGTFRTVRPPTLLRFTWDNARHSPGTIVDVRFATRGAGRTVIALQHQKLADRAAHDAMRRGWSWALDSFRSYVETGRPIREEDWAAVEPKTNGTASLRTAAAGRKSTGRKKPAKKAPGPKKAPKKAPGRKRPAKKKAAPARKKRAAG